MNLWTTRSDRISLRVGMLFRRLALSKSRAIAVRPEVSETESRGRHRLAFAGLYLFTALMYFRPHEIIPGIFGGVPVPKIVAIGTILIYLVSKIRAGERVTIWPLEMKMVALMWTMGLLLVPVSASPGESINVLFDPFVRTVIIFILLINLVDTRERLRSLLLIMVFCELLFALGAIETFLSGGYEESLSGHRIKGWGTQLGNPNDLASVLSVMMPYAVFFAMTRRGLARMFYFASAILAAIAVMLTFSRSGFLALMFAGSILMWKLTRGRRVKMLFTTAVIAVVLLMAMPGKYGARLSTIFNPSEDTTNSAQARQTVMIRAAELAVRRAIVGVGIGNFHIYSVREAVAHNSYLETAAELGLIGFIAYMVLIFAPIRSLRRIERETAEGGPRPERELYLVSVCLQASFAAYIVYGFFGSVQYMYILYFTVAYTVALRRIYSAEICEAAGASRGRGEPESSAGAGLTKGILWKPHRFRQRWLAGGNR